MTKGAAVKVWEDSRLTAASRQAAQHMHLPFGSFFTTVRFTLPSPSIHFKWERETAE